MAKILCISLNPAVDVTLSLDTFKVGEVNRIANQQSEPAGKAINVASILAQLGHQIGLTGFLGESNSQSFLDKFARLNVDNQCILVAGETRQNIKIAEKNGQMTDINGKGFVVDDTAKQKFFNKISDLVSSYDMTIVSGSLPQGFLLDDFAKLLNILKQNHAKFAVDTSGEALKIAIDYHPFLIKPNHDELAESFAKPCATLDEQLALFDSLDCNIPNIVISMGEKGVHWLKNNQSQREVLLANSPKVDVKSTVGAGDTLLAGMVHGILTSQNDKKILTNAVAMASHAVTIIGFELADSSRLHTLAEQVYIHQI